MKLLPHVPDPFDQIGLHKAVDILVFLCDQKRPVLHILSDAVQPFYDLISLLCGQDPLPGEHRHMGNTAPDVLHVKSLVK